MTTVCSSCLRISSPSATSTMRIASAELESIIADKTGKQVEVRFMLAADEGAHRGKLASIDIDERIREFIHADIEIEDEN